jgi:hypothetical protein
MAPFCCGERQQLAVTGRSYSRKPPADWPFDPSDRSVAGSRAFASVSHYDPEVLQWLFEVVGCLNLPNEVMARHGVFERVLDVALSAPPYASPGPTRAELEELLV